MQADHNERVSAPPEDRDALGGRPSIMLGCGVVVVVDK
jgi:hypothetical protein